MRIIELRQGTCGPVEGSSVDEVLHTLAERDADFLARNPGTAPWHRPSWREFEVETPKTAPWGHVWYEVDATGVLKFHSAQYDSSG